MGDALGCGRWLRTPSCFPLRLGWRGMFPRGMSSPSKDIMVTNMAEDGGTGVTVHLNRDFRAIDGNQPREYSENKGRISGR
jgi:hypothetical protein